MMKKFLSNVWGRLLAVFLSYFNKKTFLKLLKKEAIKFAFKKLLITGGIKGWLISFVVEELIEEADEHLLEPALRKLNLLKDMSDGRKVFGRIENAEDYDDWFDAVVDA